MAKIVGLEGVTQEELARELDRGAKFVVFQYCVSVVFLTVTRGTNIYFVRSDESRLVKGLPWTALSMALGWWGFPFGLIFTPIVMGKNLLGGKDVTNEVVAALYPRDEAREPVFGGRRANGGDVRRSAQRCANAAATSIVRPSRRTLRAVWPSA